MILRNSNSICSRIILKSFYIRYSFTFFVYFFLNFTNFNFNFETSKNQSYDANHTWARVPGQGGKLPAGRGGGRRGVQKG